jgi:DMSO reductase anchor subunit
MAVGAFLALEIFDLRFLVTDTQVPVLVTALVMLAGLLISLLHLGQPQRAFRAAANWRKSWLSREILSAGAFSAGLVAFNLLQWFYPLRPAYLEREGRAYWFGLFPLHSLVFYLTAASGLALVYCIVRVYRLRTLPAWNHMLTTASFITTAAILGPLLAGLLIFGASLPVIDFGFSGMDFSRFALFGWLAGIALPGLAVQAGLAWLSHQHTRLSDSLFRLRLGLITASALAALLTFAPLSRGGSANTWMAAGSLVSLAFGLALAAELLGRWMFYQKKSQHRF